MHAKLSLTYAELSRQPNVQSELQTLYDALEAKFTRSYPLKGFDEIVSSDDRAQAQAFVDRWRLPATRGVEDVVWTCSLTWDFRRGSDPARFPHLFGLIRLSAKPNGESRTIARLQGTMSEPDVIVPPTQAPFGFDPATVSRRQLVERADEIATRVKRSIVEQGDRIRDGRSSSGDWRAVPPRYRSPGELPRGARRLARRMCGMRWRDIRDAEIAETVSATDHDAEGTRRKPRATTVTDDAVQQSVEQWARELGIDLPTVDRPERGSATR